MAPRLSATTSSIPRRKSEEDPSTSHSKRKTENLTQTKMTGFVSKTPQSMKRERGSSAELPAQEGSSEVASDNGRKRQKMEVKQIDSDETVLALLLRMTKAQLETLPDATRTEQKIRRLIEEDDQETSTCEKAEPFFQQARQETSVRLADALDKKAEASSDTALTTPHQMQRLDSDTLWANFQNGIEVSDQNYPYIQKYLMTQFNLCVTPPIVLCEEMNDFRHWTDHNVVDYYKFKQFCEQHSRPTERKRKKHVQLHKLN